jgi:hypothetical protein
MFDMAMARVPQEMKEALLRNDPVVDSFLDKMIEGDARRFFIAARMWAFGAKTLKEFLLMQRDYTLKGLAEKIECPTLVCDNVADTVAGGQAKRLYAALKCPKDYIMFTAEEGADGHCEGGAQVLFHTKSFDWPGVEASRTGCPWRGGCALAVLARGQGPGIEGYAIPAHPTLRKFWPWKCVGSYPKLCIPIHRRYMACSPDTRYWRYRNSRKSLSPGSFRILHANFGEHLLHAVR